MSLKSKSLKAFFWSSLNKGSTQIINFIVFVFLARILDAEDFGLMALVSIYIAILNILIEQGFSVVIIQRKNISTEAINTVFTLSLVTSLILFFLGISFSSNISILFEKPELSKLIFAANFILLVGPFYNISSALVRKILDFKAYALSAAIASAIGGVTAIILAFQGFGVWSLLIKFFVDISILTLLLFKSATWRPQFTFSNHEFKDIVRSSSFIFGINTIKLLSRKMLDFLIAYFIGVSQLGYFDVASRLFNSLNAILAQIVASVSFPLFSEIQSDKSLSRRIYDKLFRFSLLIPVPIYILCILLASPMILFFFGPKWESTIYMAQILCAAGILQQFQSINESFLYARDKMKIKFIQELIKIGLITVLFFSLYQFGLTVIPWIVFIAATFSYIYDILVTNRILETSQVILIRENINTFFAIIFSTAVSYVLLNYLPNLSNILLMIIGSMLFYTVFISLILILDKKLKKSVLSIIAGVTATYNDKI